VPGGRPEIAGMGRTTPWVADGGVCAADDDRAHLPRKEPTVRKILTAVAAMAVMAVMAQPAAADDPGATPFRFTNNNNELVGCSTPYRTGVFGQYGANGYFHDGCTAKAYCASYARWCKVTGVGSIGVSNTNGTYMTLNAKLRRFYRSGAINGWEDGSCADYNSCSRTLNANLLSSQAASIQCNGVRQNVPTPNTAYVRCHVFVEYMYTAPPAGL
jgi:hypothetical protein